MLRLSMRYVSGDDAKDCVVVAFTKVFQSIASFQNKGPGSLDAWMRRITINEALMWLRKNHNLNLTESIEPGVMECDVTELADLEAEEIHRMISALPVGYKTTFNLAEIEGYSH